MVKVTITKASEDKFFNTLLNGATQAVNNTLYALSGDIKKKYDQYTPKLTGALRRNITLNVDTTNNRLNIGYRQPYAHYQYVNHFQNYTTPNTGGEWDKIAEAEVMQLIKDEYTKQLKDVFR